VTTKKESAKKTKVSEKVEEPKRKVSEWREQSELLLDTPSYVVDGALHMAELNSDEEVTNTQLKKVINDFLNSPA